MKERKKKMATTCRNDKIYLLEVPFVKLKTSVKNYHEQGLHLLELEGYNENLLQINVHFKPISDHFREKNNKRCKISHVKTIIFWYSMFMYLN